MRHSTLPPHLEQRCQNPINPLKARRDSGQRIPELTKNDPLRCQNLRKTAKRIIQYRRSLEVNILI
ncbi:hypothetical protein E2C01_085060 [Portunus trituberculatus]|uniref:Uncharacterized protein n=1 Tax=Portunus trituberculatus TaxID=210409 RepID=A0A5B7J6F5_PORTR|nr:hypothetical protein [Portunus trituberculatus]